VSASYGTLFAIEVPMTSADATIVRMLNNRGLLTVRLEGGVWTARLDGENPATGTDAREAARALWFATFPGAALPDDPGARSAWAV